MTQLIAVGSGQTAFSSGEFTVPAGSVVTLLIKQSADGAAPPGASYDLARKTSGGQYTTLLTLDNVNILQYGAIVGGAADQVYACRRNQTGVTSGMDYA